MTSPKLLTVREVAETLSVRPERAADLVRRNVIRSIRIGRQIRVAPEALAAFIEAGGQVLPGGWRKEAK